MMDTTGWPAIVLSAPISSARCPQEGGIRCHSKWRMCDGCQRRRHNTCNERNGPPHGLRNGLQACRRRDQSITRTPQSHIRHHNTPSRWCGSAGPSPCICVDWLSPGPQNPVCLSPSRKTLRIFSAGLARPHGRPQAISKGEWNRSPCPTTLSRCLIPPNGSSTMCNGCRGLPRHTAKCRGSMGSSIRQEYKVSSVQQQNYCIEAASQK